MLDFDPAAGRVPRWLKLAWSAWMVLWVPVYWIENGPANFLWLCDVANFVVLAALWLESRLLFSSQAVGVLLIQLVWIVDVAGRLVVGHHLIGGTEYMFDPAQPLAFRALSLFHVVVPALLVWALWRFGYDRRGYWLQSALTVPVLVASFFADPARNLNWLWQPFGVPQTWMPPAAWLLVCIAAYPLAVYLPGHLLLRRFARSPDG